MEEKVLTTVKLDKNLHTRIRIFCIKNGKKMNDFYEEAAEKLLKQLETV